MIRRSIVILSTAVIAAGLFQLDDPHSTSQAPESIIVGPSISESGSATWFCAGGAGGVEGATHELLINNSGDAVTARIVGFTSVEQESSTSTVELESKSELVVNVADLGAEVTSATVEASGNSVTVAHRISTESSTDQANCETEAASTWHFASANTEAGNSARLWVLNPYASDASVDVRVSNDASVLIPPKLRGIIIPAGSARVIELGEAQERRDQFAFSVESRGSLVSAELVQTISGQGLRMQPGVSQPSSRWVLADSFGGEGVAESLFLFNPSSDDTTVTVSVIPNETAVEMFPEPFVVEIAGRRYAQLDLAAETRIPDGVLRWIVVHDLGSNGVVVNQLVSISAGGGDGTADTRPSVAGGLTSSAGSTVQAGEWFIPAIDPGPDSQSVVVVANSSPDAIALVTLSRVQGGNDESIVESLEVPPMQSLVVDVTPAVTDSMAGLRVTSEIPIMVSARSTSAAKIDLAMWPAFPRASTAETLNDVDEG